MMWSIVSAVFQLCEMVIKAPVRACEVVVQPFYNFTEKLGDDCHSCLESIVDILNKGTNDFLLHVAAFTRTCQIGVSLLINAVLGLFATIALRPLLELSELSPTLRAIVWMMYASLCLSMISTYVQQQYPNFSIRRKIHNHKYKYDMNNNENRENSSSMKHVQRLIESIKSSKDISNVIKDLPPTLAEYLLSSISPNHKKQIPSSYDFVVDLTNPTDIYETLKAYPLSFPLGKEVYDEKTKHQYNRFIVNVVGRYNVGKTYVLRLLSNINLGHSFTERTNGISVSLPSLEVTNQVPIALIDTAGSRTPVEFNTTTFHKQSYEKQISDSFVQEIAFNSAEVFLFVLNQLTLDDELYLKTLYKRLKENGYKDEEIKQRLLIVHNYFNLRTIEEIQSVEENELKELFHATKQPQGYWVSENFKHFVLASSHSKAGTFYNKKAVEQINTMILGSQASAEADVLSRILREIEKLLSKFLIEQSTISLSSKPNQANDEDIGGYVAAVIARDHNKQHRLELTDKRNIHVKLKVEELFLNEAKPIYFICPEIPFSNTVILSKNLKFNEDGSVYVDYSSQFIPDMQVSKINGKDDIIIIIECPSCSSEYAVLARKRSIIVQAEKILNRTVKDYINTRRAGKFEIEIPIGKLDEDRVFDFRLVKHRLENGVIIIEIPALNDEF